MLIFQIDWSENSSRNFDNNVITTCAFNLAEGSNVERYSWQSMPNSEGGKQLHPEHDFIVVAELGQIFTAGATQYHVWKEEDNVTEDWFTTHENLINTALEGKGSLTYTEIDMVNRKCTSRLEASTDRTSWEEYPYIYHLNLDYMKIELDAGSNFLCSLLITDDWASWTTQVRDVLAGTTETINSPAPGKTVYLTFSEDVLVNGNAVAAGDTLKLTSASFEVTASENTKILTNFG